MKGMNDMPENTVRRRRPPIKKKCRGALAAKIAAGIAVLLVVAVIGAMASGVSVGSVKRMVKNMLGDYVYAIPLVGDWSGNANEAYKLMRDKKKELDDGAIAFFIQTDPHGRAVPTALWMQLRDRSVKNIALGDVTTDYFNEKELQAFRKIMDPVSNKISVFGNHDVWTKSDEAANYETLEACFPSSGKQSVDEYGYFSVVDDEAHVKYLVVSPYYINLETGSNGADVTVKTAQMKWLLDEMSAEDGYDMIVLMHQVYAGTYYTREGNAEEAKNLPVMLTDLWQLMADRKNKRSGTIVDGEGVSHAYDFSNMKTELLCSLHGHMHEELMRAEDGLTAYAADWLAEDYTCTLGLIDRSGKRMYIWKFNKHEVLDMLELPI